MPGRMRQEARPAGRVASMVAWVVVLVLVFGPPMAVAFLAGCEYQARQLERLHGRRLS
jgi:hypothetical protein